MTIKVWVVGKVDFLGVSILVCYDFPWFWLSVKILSEFLKVILAYLLSSEVP